jgi:ABC-2 type transport system ATP-binding protein
MDEAPVISLRGVSKFYGRHKGVADLDLHVAVGEMFGFLGPNGAGKTTTIRLLMHLLHPTAGQIRLFGQDPDRHSVAIRQRCGYLPGDFAAPFHLTGREYLDFVAALRGQPLRRRDEICRRLNLSADDLRRRIKHLSHGTQQKLGIVQALAPDPALLILDEPSAGLDPLMQEEFYQLLREANSRGVTVFLSSHNLAEVQKICRRVGVIRAGTLAGVDTLDNLRRRTARRLCLVLRHPQPDLELPGAERLSVAGCRLEFRVTGDPAPLLAALARLPVKEVVLPEPDLEEVFMSFYGRDHHA